MAQRKPPGGRLLRRSRLRRKAERYFCGWDLFCFRPDYVLTASNVVDDTAKLTMDDIMAARDKLQAEMERRFIEQIIRGTTPGIFGEPSNANYAPMKLTMPRWEEPDDVKFVEYRMRNAYVGSNLTMRPVKVLMDTVCE